ncbi:MAG: hypothetical protein ACK4IB_10885 [Erythrobacter sp.]|jgi:hypothetical protein
MEVAAITENVLLRVPCGWPAIGDVTSQLQGKLMTGRAAFARLFHPRNIV